MLYDPINYELHYLRKRKIELYKNTEDDLCYHDIRCYKNEPIPPSLFIPSALDCSKVCKKQNRIR